MKWWLLFLILCYPLYRFCHMQTAGFQTVKVISYLSPEAQWDLPTDLPRLDPLLSQPFFYLDKGGQSYAFLSQDGKIVLKLFKMSNIRQYPFLNHQRDKLERLFGSAHLAYTQLRCETGLLYLTLNPDPELEGRSLLLVDKLGITHKLPLGHIPFALQKRADRAMLLLKKHVKRREMKAAQEVLDAMLFALQTRRDKGIHDRDPALRRNLGITEGHALFMDIGSFSTNKAPEDNATEDLFRWIRKHAPELTYE
jgi:hypothetical protein